MSEPYVTNSQPFAMIPETLIRSGSSRAVHLYAVLARHTDAQHAAYPSVKRLAKWMSCSPDTVRRARDELEDLGVLDVETRHTDGRQTSNRYRIVPNGAPPPSTGARGEGRTGARGRTRAIKNETKTLPSESDGDAAHVDVQADLPVDVERDDDANPKDAKTEDKTGVTATVNVEGFDQPLPIATSGTPLTGHLVGWAVQQGLAEDCFRTPLEDARLAVSTVAQTIGRKGKAVTAAIAIVGDYVTTIRGQPLNRRTWGMLQASVSNRGPTTVLDALAEALDRGAGLDGGHETKGTVAVVEYALAILRGERQPA